MPKGYEVNYCNIGSEFEDFPTMFMDLDIDFQKLISLQITGKRCGQLSVQHQIDNTISRYYYQSILLSVDTTITRYYYHSILQSVVKNTEC